MLKSKCNWLGFGAVLVALQGMSGLATATTYKDAVLADGPRYYWTFDEASGSALNYGLATGGNLGVQNGATRVASGTTNAGGNSLSLGSASEHDGTGRAFSTTVTGGSSISDGTYSSYAYEFWFKRATGPTAYLMGTHPVVNRSVPLLNTNMRIEYYAGGAGRTLDDGPLLSLDTWQHIIIGFKENGATDTTTFYLDGVLAGTSTLVSNRVLFSEADPDGFIVGGVEFPVGSGTVVNAPKGLLDEIAIYDLSSLDQTGYDAKLAALASHYTAAVPEPGALSLALCALGLLAGCRLRKGVRRQ